MVYNVNTKEVTDTGSSLTSGVLLSLKTNEYSDKIGIEDLLTKDSLLRFN